ncbi:hypothetical protein Pelo_16876 [Pelomyxa schiedti]|nr:hypothetical protein Pelo_16876 [Pelomyxa schiedti]
MSTETSRNGARRTTKLVVTGFGPFGSVTTNPTDVVVSKLARGAPLCASDPRFTFPLPPKPASTPPASAPSPPPPAAAASASPVATPAPEVVAAVLSVDRSALDVVQALWAEHADADAFVHLGVNSEAATFDVERAAVNVLRTGANGEDPDAAVVPGAAADGFLTDGAVCRTIYNCLEMREVQATESFHAGTYFCNAVLFRSLLCRHEHATGASGRGSRGPIVLFVHIPGRRSMEYIEKGVAILLKSVFEIAQNRDH